MFETPECKPKQISFVLTPQSRDPFFETKEFEGILETRAWLEARYGNRLYYTGNSITGIYVYRTFKEARRDPHRHNALCVITGK